MRFAFAAFALASVVNAVPTWWETLLRSDSEPQNLVPLVTATNADVIQGSYIVVFKDDVDSDRLANHHLWLQQVHLLENESGLVGSVKHTYDLPGFRGYSGQFSDKFLHMIRSSDEVAYVEKDQMVYASEIQRGAPWGLARISNRPPLTLTSFNKYYFNETAGEGVTVYVVDTGVNIDHIDFEGRAVWGATIPEGDDDIDGNGHGSHVAGTIAGKKYGVAKKAQVVAVKVLRSNGSGSMSDVLKGVEYVGEAHKLAEKEAKKNKNKKFKGSAANMSLGGGKSPTLDRVVDAVVTAGVHFAVAAGNDNRDACSYSPAGAEKAITVGAATIEDERASFSNFGPCVDIFAPGKDIKSIWTGTKTGTNTISGTSMASPHVAGLAAYYLSILAPPTSAFGDDVLFLDEEIDFPIDCHSEDDDEQEEIVGLLLKKKKTISPKKLKKHILNLATRDALDLIPDDTPNLLIYNDPPRPRDK